MNSVIIKDNDDVSLLDDNQKYDVVRRAVIFFFAKNSNCLESFGLNVVDFPSVMKFVKDTYYSYRKDNLK